MLHEGSEGMGRAATVLLPAFLGVLAMLAAGCLSSGPFGARPEMRGLTEGGEIVIGLLRRANEPGPA